MDKLLPALVKTGKPIATIRMNRILKTIAFSSVRMGGGGHFTGSPIVPCQFGPGAFDGDRP
ncbi:MAG: hypothetical protein KAR36_04135 [Candidatus Latescibacteria bacterium]|nr:hypothetical protein [Candidatus Latescibacterota bacterium]